MRLGKRSFQRAPLPGRLSVPADAPRYCVDELAYAVGKDPVALRLANDTNVDAITKRFLSSRHLSACLHRGAERIGWSKRPRRER
jgi:xanthine dehydrogenase YagR molybdenum-binding subunit